MAILKDVGLKEMRLIELLYSKCGVDIKVIYRSLKEIDSALSMKDLSSIIRSKGLKKGIVFSDSEKALIHETYCVKNGSVSKVFESVLSLNKYRKRYHVANYISENKLVQSKQWTEGEIAILYKYFSVGGSRLCKEKGLNRSISEIGYKARSIGVCMSKEYKQWSAKEDDYLRANVSILSKEEMSVVLDRSLMSVTLRMQRIGLATKYIKWTEEELAIVHKYYPDGGATLCKEKGLGRTKGSIAQRAKELGLKAKGVQWAKEEDAILYKYYREGGYQLCRAKGLNRTKAAISNRVIKFGICSDLAIPKEKWDYWTEEDVAILKKYYPIGGYPLCRDNGLNKANMLVTAKASNLGLKSGRERGWPKEDIAILKKYYIEGGVKLCKVKGLNYSDAYIYTKAYEYGISSKTAPKKWSDYELNILTLYYPEGGAKLCIAKGLKRSAHTIYICELIKLV